MALQLTANEQRDELSAQRRQVDFDTYDVTVDELLRRVQRKRIDIAPVYQRQFRWDTERQSTLIESVLLGIPIPPLFMATNIDANKQNRWEVVDGLQRLLTLVNFAGDQKTRTSAKLTTDRLTLSKLEKLESFNRCTFESLPEDIRSAFEDRPLKIIILNDKSQLQVRFDLFERLNTGGIALTQQEIRECVYRGDFVDLLGELADSDDFKRVVILPEARTKDGTPKDFVLRYFAYSEAYADFEHIVKDFLKAFMEDAFENPRTEERKEKFHRTFRYLSACFPEGIKTRKGQTPVNLYEALSAGAALALSQEPDLQPPSDLEWVESPELKHLVTGATNSRPRVRDRIEFCRDKFIG
ncbi:DUF262 domain-containing protein [Streptomyces sp. CA-111067]|uniref:DUF262 domain-containing protein n=1 Tax=Streptomyces sp. CA-111067 TaxID=3240046 RepID=UPI003D9613D7